MLALGPGTGDPTYSAGKAFASAKTPQRPRIGHARPVAGRASADPNHKEGQRRIDRRPMVIVLGWWAFCMSLFLLDWPIQYDHTSDSLVVTLVGVSGIASVVGYVLGSRVGDVPARVAELGQEVRHERAHGVLHRSRLPYVGLVISALLLLPTIASYTGLRLSSLRSALDDQGRAYALASDVIERGSGGRTSLLFITTLLAPLTLAALPYFSLRAFERVGAFGLVGAALTPSIILSILSGRTQQLGVATIVLGSGWLIGKRRRRARIRVVEWLTPLLILLVLFTVVAIRKTERLEGRFLCRPGQLNCQEKVAGLEDAVLTIASYASQGFYGLSVALKADWSFGGGYSHSPALLNFSRLLGGSNSSQTVTDQLPGLGWSDRMFWSSGWSQLANDVPWILLPLLMFFVGVMFGSAWTQALLRGDWLSAAVAGYAFVGLIFMPQNYQLGSSGPLYVGVLALSAAFLVRLWRDHSGRTRASTLSGKPVQPGRRRAVANR